MTARAHIRAEDLAEVLNTLAGPMDIIDPDVSLRLWFALNSADPVTAQATLAHLAAIESVEYANGIVARMTEALEAAGPEGVPA